MIKEFNNLEEMQKYYDKATNTYVFKENDRYIDLVVFNFDLKVESTINAWNINAYDIDAYDIDYFAVCFAYGNIKCKSIKGRRKNHKHFVLDGKLEVEEKQ